MKRFAVIVLTVAAGLVSGCLEDKDRQGTGPRLGDRAFEDGFTDSNAVDQTGAQNTNNESEGFAAVSTQSYAANFRKLATYRNVGSALNSRVGPGPEPGSERYYQTYIYDGGVFHLMSINPNDGNYRTFPGPVPHLRGAWGMTVGPDDNLYIGTLTADPSTTKARLLRFDPRTSTYTDLGQSTTETYIWQLDVGQDGKIYGCTYPNAKLIRYSPATGLLEDLGRLDPAEHYARQMAAGSDGYVYVSVGFAKNKIIAYNIATGTHKVITDASYEGDIVHSILKRADGKIYATMGGYAFRLENGTATRVPVTTLPEIKPLNRLRDGRTITVDLSTEKRSTTVYDPATGAKKVYTFPYGGGPINIFTLNMGPNRTLYGSGYLPGHVYGINADTGALNKVGILAGGEFYNFLPWGNKLLGAAYYGLQKSPLMIYDPSKPLTDLTQPSTPTSNPIFVHYEGEFPDWRPQAMIWGPDNKVYLGSFSGYGKLGGPLVVWDPATNVIENFPALITDQSIVSLTVADGKIVGSTTVRGGGGSAETQTQAKIFIWDPVTKKKMYESVLHPTLSMRNIFALTTAPNGFVYGSADGKLFSFDPVSKKIVLTTTSIGTMGNTMGIGTGGLLWLANKNAIFAVEPYARTILYNIPVPSPVTAGGWAIDEQNIYYGAGPDAYRFTMPKVEYYAVPLNTDGTSYAPNNSYYGAKYAGTHKAWLRGPHAASFDLHLLKWDTKNSKWMTVASSTSSSSNEQIVYSGAAGTYMWKVTGVKYYRYFLWMERP
jgi:hypothetical protein